MILFLNSCASKSATYNGRLYLGNSKDSAVIEKNGDYVRCADPEFDNYICMPKQDFQDLIDALLQKAER